MEDKAIIKKIIDGDEDAFAEVFFRYEKYVFAVVKRLVKADRDAEEVTQDVFYRMFRNISGFKGESKLSTWLYRIARNLSLNRIRDTKQERENTQEIPEIAAHKAPGPEEQYEKKRAMDAINSLPDKYKRVLILYYTEGLTYAEIAKELKIPINTVKIHIKRAKEAARKKLDGT